MNAIDLSPLYRNSIGFDRLASLLDSALNKDTTSSAYPPYNIEMLDENRYTITLAIAGFENADLDIQVEKGVLSIRGKKTNEEERQYLYQGIAHRAFERKFNLAEYVEVVDAELKDGLLTINLVKEVPEAMKPRTITISQRNQVLEHNTEEKDHQAA
ncbi:MAG: Hsp20 family protein [Gammaproteobacteria bacterium]